MSKSKPPGKRTKKKPFAGSLAHHLLIAMPAMDDPHFARSVTYICEHDADGAMGIVINRPLTASLAELLGHMKIASTDQAVLAILQTSSVLGGGPVQPDHGFILHKPDSQWASTWNVNAELAITTSPDILEAIAAGTGPKEALVALGYAGWGAGQLEQEIMNNAWLTVPAAIDIVFATPLTERWQAATRLLGIDITQLSGSAGHA